MFKSKELVAILVGNALSSGTEISEYFLVVLFLLNAGAKLVKDEIMPSIHWLTKYFMVVLIWAQGPVSQKSRNFSGAFRVHNSLCIFKTTASRGTKICIPFTLYEKTSFTE